VTATTERGTVFAGFDGILGLSAHLLRARLLPCLVLPLALGCVYEPVHLAGPNVAALADAAGPAPDARADLAVEAGGSLIPDVDGPSSIDLAPDVEMVRTTLAPLDGGPTERPPCVERTREIRAIDGVSLDYGPPPRDPPTTDPLELSVGRLHEHDHDVVAWLKFPLDELPPGARLRGARLHFTAQIAPPTPVPDISLVHSPWDGWSNSSTDPVEIPRATPVGGGSGPLLRGRQSAPVDLGAYGPLWPRDLADGFVTIGIAPADDPDGPFRYATVQSSVPGDGGDPMLELTTCE
jgi:hypothetical protein